LQDENPRPGTSTHTPVQNEKMKLPPVLALGKLALKSCYLLSPLEGVSCVGFRQLCHRNGAGLTFTEMVRSQGILRNNVATLELIDTYDPETPTGLQLLAKSAKELASTLERLGSLSEQPTYAHFKNICAVDINLGCPSPDIIREGAGPALLKRKKLLSEMFTVLSEWRNTQQKLPNVHAVGCKIRLGLNEKEQGHKVYISVAEIVKAAGLDWLTVHARHANQRSSDLPTWPAIAEVVNAVKSTDGVSSSIKIIGNGNVTSREAAAQMHGISNCNGFMIARAAIRNPWVFEHFNNEIDASAAERWPTASEVRAAMKEYSDIASKYNTKPKFVKFHEENFKRLLKAAETGDTNQPFRSPKTIHL
jgi:tRNA-dihydrouridine synthase B